MILLECSERAQQQTFKPYMCEICSCFTLNNPLWRSLERIAVRGKASVLKKVAAHCFEEVISDEYQNEERSDQDQRCCFVKRHQQYIFRPVNEIMEL